MSTTDNEKVKANDIFKTANIIIAGITGAGKSTLINAVFGKDFAETGKGRPVTQEIREYRNDSVPVRIWDSIGFEIGNDNNGVSKTKASITKIKKTIEEQSSKDQVDHIHAIWYCINQGGSRYQPTEAEFVKELHTIGVSAESVFSPDTACYAPADADRQDTFVPDGSTAMPPPFF